MNRSVVFGIGFFVVATAVAIGCGGSDVPVLQNGASDLGILDAGTGKCGNAACGSGELCCASADESCSPTCMAVTKCPVYGRPCKVDTDGGPQTDAGGDAGPALTWYSTCGDPVCRAPDPDAGTPPTCPPVGSACTTKGESCGDPKFNCGVTWVCDDHDPKGAPGMCPVSSKKFKQDISYVDAAELARLHDETMAMKLATYRYKGQFVDPKDPNAVHLGFIVEDQPQSLSVDRGHDRVDIYGYMSMAVATMQVQEKKLNELQQKIDRLEKACPSKAR